jgi:hypothetical protein
MYKQTLYKIVEPIKRTTIIKKNKSRSWHYGYNEEHDLIIISKDGTIGEIYDIQGLVVALPRAPKDLDKKHNKWVAEEQPKELKLIQSVFDWRNYPDAFKERWDDYINNQFEYRENGYWFMNNDKPSYLTGSHWMYLQWS